MQTITALPASPFDDAVAVLNGYEQWPDLRQPASEFAYDMKRQLGEEGWSLYLELALDEYDRDSIEFADLSTPEGRDPRGPAETVDAYEARLRREWDAIDTTRGPTQFDRLISDELLRIADHEAEQERIDARLDDFRDWLSSMSALPFNTWRRRRLNSTTAVEMESGVPMGKLIQSDIEFVASFEPPSYLLDGILQRGYCYSLTAATGAGKTAIALRLAAHVGIGRKFGDRDVEQGRVLYFASENYVDVQARWIAMAENCGFQIGSTNVHFVSGATNLGEIAQRISNEADTLGDLALVVVDTSAATFAGSDENSNVDMIEHAKRMRSLTALKGRPAVLVLCHPVKSATGDNLQPRGGGSFIAEIDGNLCARKTDSIVELHHSGKFRGPDFAPMLFRLDTVTASRLRDARGRSMPAVLATPVDETTKSMIAAAGKRDEDLVLRAIEQKPGANYSELARHLGWAMRDGKPYSVKVRRAAESLAGDALIMKHRGAWMLSARGQKELNKLDTPAVQPMMPITPLPRAN